MLRWRCDKVPHPFHRCFYLNPGDIGTLFRDSMRQHHCLLAMKEIKDAVIHRLILKTQFINTILKIIGLRALKFVSAFLKPLNSHCAFILRLFGQPMKPFQKRGPPTFIAIEYYRYFRQLIPPTKVKSSQFCELLSRHILELLRYN